MFSNLFDLLPKIAPQRWVVTLPLPSITHEKYFSQKWPFISVAYPIKRDKWQTIIINFSVMVQPRYLQFHEQMSFFVYDYPLMNEAYSAVSAAMILKCAVWLSCIRCCDSKRDVFPLHSPVDFCQQFRLQTVVSIHTHVSQCDFSWLQLKRKQILNTLRNAAPQTRVIYLGLHYNLGHKYTTHFHFTGTLQFYQSKITI